MASGTLIWAALGPRPATHLLLAQLFFPRFPCCVRKLKNPPLFPLNFNSAGRVGPQFVAFESNVAAYQSRIELNSLGMSFSRSLSESCWLSCDSVYVLISPLVHTQIKTVEFYQHIFPLPMTLFFTLINACLFVRS